MPRTTKKTRAVAEDSRNEAVASDGGSSKKFGSSGAASGSRSLPIARRGVATAGDFAGLMSALMSDVLEGKVTPQIVNASCNAGGKMLKAVEMQLKYGKPEAEQDSRVLRLV